MVVSHYYVKSEAERGGKRKVKTSEEKRQQRRKREKKTKGVYAKQYFRFLDNYVRTHDPANYSNYYEEHMKRICLRRKKTINPIFVQADNNSFKIRVNCNLFHIQY